MKCTKPIRLSRFCSTGRPAPIYYSPYPTTATRRRTRKLERRERDARGQTSIAFSLRSQVNILLRVNGESMRILERTSQPTHWTHGRNHTVPLRPHGSQKGCKHAFMYPPQVQNKKKVQIPSVLFTYTRSPRRSGFSSLNQAFLSLLDRHIQLASLPYLQRHMGHICHCQKTINNMENIIYILIAMLSVNYSSGCSGS